MKVDGTPAEMVVGKPETISVVAAPGEAGTTSWTVDAVTPRESVTVTPTLYWPDRSGVKVGAAAVVLESAAALPAGAISVQAYVSGLTPPPMDTARETCVPAVGMLGFAVMGPAVSDALTVTLAVNPVEEKPFESVTISCTV